MIEQVCNEEVTINYNGQSKTFKNYLLTNFLEKFVDNNFGNSNNFGMTLIYGYFGNEELIIDENTYIDTPDFDNLDNIVPLNAYKENYNIKIVNTSITTQKSANEISYIYRYKLYDFNNKKIKEQNSQYIGEKINYLLFGTPSEIYAILDVRDENLIYYENENNIDIFRRDIIRTKGIFNSKDVSYPYHLLCIPEKINDKTVTSELVSIGMGYNSKLINEEIPIEELKVKTNKNNIYIRTDFREIDTENSIYPKTQRHPMNNKHPMAHVTQLEKNINIPIPNNHFYMEDDLFPLEYKYELRNEIYKKKVEFPSKKFPSSLKHPLKSYGNYKYIIIKYKLKDISNEKYINKEYCLAYPLKYKNKYKIVISYERSEK